MSPMADGLMSSASPLLHSPIHSAAHPLTQLCTPSLTRWLHTHSLCWGLGTGTPPSWRKADTGQGHRQPDSELEGKNAEE